MPPSSIGIGSLSSPHWATYGDTRQSRISASRSNCDISDPFLKFLRCRPIAYWGDSQISCCVTVWFASNVNALGAARQAPGVVGRLNRDIALMAGLAVVAGPISMSRQGVSLLRMVCDDSVCQISGDYLITLLC